MLIPTSISSLSLSLSLYSAMPTSQPSPLSLPLLLFLSLTLPDSSSPLDFLFNTFSSPNTTTSSILLTNDAVLDSSSAVLRLTNDSSLISTGRVFYTTQFRARPDSNRVGSFSTQFVFSILPEISTSPGFGLVFVLSNSTDLPGALSGQYLGVFSNATTASVAPLVGVEFDTGRNTEFNDPDGNHVGIDLNNIESKVTESAGYYNSTGGITPLNMRNGQNIHVWIEFNGSQSQINVTIAPAGSSRPSNPLLSYKDPAILDYLSPEMYIGFSASKTTWVETQRILAWSFSDTGVARDINTTNLPVFELKISSTSLSAGAIAGVTIGCFFGFLLFLLIFYLLWRKYIMKREDDEVVEDWELEYWPHRFSYEELKQATNGFSKDELLGAGGFGKVYKATLDNKNDNKSEVAVKCVNHDSKQGLREFMAEISSMGRLQHKNLVQMRGWCRKGNELMLVYDYMRNGSLNRWIFDNPEKVMSWEDRKRVLADVAEGLNYLHHGWDQVVIHRDIKSSNVLLDNEMRGRLGDFGLAKLYTHGEVPNTTRVVGTLGYLAPELATLASPTAASDVYSFGVVILEVVCGRRPIDVAAEREEDVVLIDWVREKYDEGNLWEAADRRIKGEYDVAEIEAMLKLGLSCCHPDPTRRPDMRAVVAVLLGGDYAEAPGIMLSELEQGDKSIGSVDDLALIGFAE